MGNYFYSQSSEPAEDSSEDKRKDSRVVRPISDQYESTIIQLPGFWQQRVYSKGVVLEQYEVHGLPFKSLSELDLQGHLVIEDVEQRMYLYKPAVLSKPLAK